MQTPTNESVAVHMKTLHQVAESQKLTLHESVTAERLMRADPRFISHPEPLTKNNSQWLDVDRATADQWIAAGHSITPYHVGQLGDEAIGVPKHDPDRAMIVLRTWYVVSHCTGQGQIDDGENSTPCEMGYTILSAHSA